MNRPKRTTRPAPLSQLALVGLMTFISHGLVAGEPAPRPAKPADLFRLTNIWTVHFKFTSNQWEAMEPKQDDNGSSGGFGARGGFGPGMMLAKVFLQQGDQNEDGKLSRDEFQALGQKWFGDWDKERSGKLNGDQLRAGINSTFLSPGVGLAGAGGLGGRGGARNLQGAEGKRNGLAASRGIEFEYVHADLEFEGQLLKDVGVRYKGNGTFMQSRFSIKRSLKVDLNRYVKGQKLAGVGKLNFHNNVSDASWMNEVLSHRLFRDAGVPAPRTAYARVFITVPGLYDRHYFGLYSLVEDLDKYFAAEAFGTKKGAIFKPVTPNLFGDLGNDWAKYKQTYDPKTEVSDQETGRVMEFCRLVSQADDAEFAAKVGQYLDLEEFARFMSVTVWLSTLDSLLGPGQNFYVYLHPKTRQFQFLPWDLDHSFGQFPMMGTQEQRENLDIHKPWAGNKRFLERVFKVEAFQKLYLARLAEFSQTIFKPARFLQQVDEVAAAIRPAVREESEEKLAQFDKVVAGESVEPAGPGGLFGGGRRDGERAGGRGGMGQPRKPIKAFVKVRAQSVLDQLAGKSAGETIEGFGFGGRGGRGGGGGPGGPGAAADQGGFRPVVVLGNAVMTALDADRDGQITRDEFRRGFARWFEAWNTAKNGVLTEEQLRAGITRDLLPSRGGMRGGFGFGPGNGAFLPQP